MKNAMSAVDGFNLPRLRAEIVNRIVLGDRVIDHERVWGVRDTPIGPKQACGG